ncbi:3-deoxy-D-manno-octulosonic acid transferase [Roseisolibacter agri]|uniref:3-deoxy-D-manno-octulosonic acid transferase n=1 Tax=Roseisolibacter agri TaxID=2014610 RepID=A0AA37VB23_9BACT|nr:glycosyltransferase N-terminal domain-containing protein [Roseisolibacter agri]GLC26008.1 3-deoxy-D-manno-octulosonic acid transferase [Roseisolibacter agri]
MNPLARTLYAVVGQAARAAAALTPDGSGKLRRTLRARRGLRARWTGWARDHRDASRPLLWMHAPSVGEGLQARPVLELARRERPDLQLAYSFYSPSAERFGRGLDVDVADYLPFDTGGDAAALLDALKPKALVFSKLDVWPVLAAEAARRRVKLGLVSATLAEGSSRRGGLAGGLLREAYARLDLVGAISEQDAERLVALGVRPDRVRVTGDTRYDQVWRRAESADRASALLAPLARERSGGRFTLVAGSTWPADERVLLEAWQTMRRQDARARLVVAPHEPTPAHLAPIEEWARAQRATLARLSAVEEGSASGDVDVVLVDRVGVLGDLYAIGDAAFVGGGFHDAGLHSVLEPAAFALPVVFGPQHTDSRDAGLLLAAGGASTVATPRTLAELLRRWRTSETLLQRSGESARQVVRDGLGADVRAWTLVQELLG